MTRVAFLGLGRMGAPMAHRAIAVGHDVVVWNRTTPRAEGFPRIASSPIDAVLGADVVVTMLTDADAVRAVMFDSGATRAMRPDAVYVDMSTIGVAAGKRLHESVGRATLDAPVGGGTAFAAAGELTVLAGGEATVIDRVRSVLESFGDVLHCGGPGAGQAMKLCFNAVLAVAMAGVGEAVGLGERLGLDKSAVLDVLSRGGAGPMIARKRHGIADGTYTPTFELALMSKDVGLVHEAGRDAGAWQPLATIVRELFDRAANEGLGDLDYSAIVELFTREH